MKHLYLSIIALLLAQTIFAAEPINKMCPVTPEEEVETWITTEYQGQTIGFCCNSCKRDFLADPEAYTAKLGLDASQPVHAAAHTTEETTHSDAAHSHTAKTDLADLTESSTPNQESGHADAEKDSDAHPHGTVLESTESEAHDHATDHGGGDDHGDDSVSPILIFLGKFHVLSVHLPIALLPLAALLEIAGMVLRSPTTTFAARLNFTVGACSALLAASLGWIVAGLSNYPGELAEVLTWHRWMGVSVASIAAIGLLGLLIQKRSAQWGITLYRVAAFICLILVPVTAHFGGTLIYGKNYLF